MKLWDPSFGDPNTLEPGDSTYMLKRFLAVSFVTFNNIAHAGRRPHSGLGFTCEVALPKSGPYITALKFQYSYELISMVDYL